MDYPLHLFRSDARVAYQVVIGPRVQTVASDRHAGACDEVIGPQAIQAFDLFWLTSANASRDGLQYLAAAHRKHGGLTTHHKGLTPRRRDRFAQEKLRLTPLPAL